MFIFQNYNQTKQKLFPDLKTITKLKRITLYYSNTGGEVALNGTNQELMNRHGEKERLTSVPILCRIALQNAPYKDYKLLVLTSFEITTVTSMDSQEPACCDDGAS